MTPRSRATVDGRPIAEAGALDAIDARPEAEPVSFAFDVATGPRYRIGDVAIRPTDRAGVVAGHRSRQARPGAGRSRRRRGHPGGAGQAHHRAAQAGLCAGQHQARRRGQPCHARGDGDLRRRDRSARPHGPGALLGHRQGRHRLAAAPRAVQGGRALRSHQGRRPARQAHLARRVQRGAHQARGHARRQRRAADRRRTDRPAVALDRLRHLLRDAARLRGLGLLDPSQPVRPGREPAADGRAHPYRRRAMRSSTPALPSAPPSASPTGGSAARMRGWRRPGCARCSTPIRATP